MRHENWAVTVVNPSPQPFVDRLGATVEQLGAARSVLRQVIALADDSATLSTEELRDRLTALAEGHLAADHHAVVEYGRGAGTR